MVVSGRWLMLTRFAVKLTLAAAIPLAIGRLVSSFDMHPAQRIPGTEKLVSGSAVSDARGAGAFMAGQ